MRYYKNTSLIDIEGEVWLPVIGWDGFYMVSNMARIKSIDRLRNHWRGGKQISRGRILKQTIRKGYLEVNLCVNNSTLALSVARIVCTAFNKNPNNLPVINHDDLNKLNNLPSNLYFTTISGNTQHAWDNGAFKNSKLYKRNRL